MPTEVGIPSPALLLVRALTEITDLCAEVLALEKERSP